MRVAYFIRLGLIVGWQISMAIVIIYFGLRWALPHWLLYVCGASGLILPLVGYYLTFYRASAFSGLPPIVRPVVLTLAFIIATFAGFYISLCLVFSYCETNWLI